MNYLIAADIGTQGTKCVLYDEAMRAVSDAFCPSNLISPSPGTVWQDADAIYASVLRVASEVMEKSGVSPKDVCGMGIDSQSAGIMGIRADGEASTYYDSWLDTRCAKYAAEMNARAGKEIIRISGGPASYTIGPKILWWMHEQKEAYDNTAKFVIPAGYVIGKLCGKSAEDATFTHTCLHFSNFGDNLRKVWSDDLLFMFGADKNKMARIASPFELAGTLTGQAARACGLCGGIPVAVGAGDTSAGVFGSGITKSGLLSDTAGSASVLCAASNEYRPDAEYETLVQMRSPIENLWHPLAYINGGGLCVRWFKDTFTGTPAVSYEELQKEAQAVPAGSEGVIFIPHFGGRVLPNDPYVKGSFTGIDLRHTRAHFYRAVLEGIAYEYAYYFDVIKKEHPDEDFTVMYTMGGGSKSALFNQIKADVLGVPVVAYKQPETALAGSAVIAGVMCGLFADYEEPLSGLGEYGETYLPNAENHQKYKAFAEQYLSVIDALRGAYQSPVYND